MSQITRIWDSFILLLHWSLIPLVLFGFIWNFTPDDGEVDASSISDSSIPIARQENSRAQMTSSTDES
jgi:regulatory protein YycH of two-component signal transduction system YycFG